MVLVDYENMHKCAGDAFDLANGHFWPWKLGELLVDRRNARKTARPCELAQVRVYRGLPDARRQPKANAANQAQTAAWKSQCGPDDLYVYNRPLRYPKNWPKSQGGPQEKGVDVALAVDLVRLTYQGAYNVCIVCSHDTDLAPALDAADGVGTTAHHLEVASWAKRRRISYSDRKSLPWCHRLSRSDFDQVADPTSYP